jgi:hypothetical protein
VPWRCAKNTPEGKNAGKILGGKGKKRKKKGINDKNTISNRSSFYFMNDRNNFSNLSLNS